MIRFQKNAGALMLATILGMAVFSPSAVAKEVKETKSKPTDDIAVVIKNTKRGHAEKVSYSPSTVKGKFLQSGVASYYGPGFHGRRTANGETFNMNALTAAHRTLPFGTKLKVTNLANGKSTVVRVNDRGPYVNGRVLDLSVAAARAIGSTSSGTARVKLEAME